MMKRNITSEKVAVVCIPVRLLYVMENGTGEQGILMSDFTGKIFLFFLKFWDSNGQKQKQGARIKQILSEEGKRMKIPSGPKPSMG